MLTTSRTREDILSEMKSLKPGDRICCYANYDLVYGTVETVKVQKDGDEEDVYIRFTDDGLVKGEDGGYYDAETGAPVYEYIGWCTGIEYFGKVGGQAALNAAARDDSYA